MRIKKSGYCYWITGLSAAGKTTIANSLASLIRQEGQSVIILDGDVLRSVFGFSGYSRDERLLTGFKYSKLAQMLVDQGSIVIVSVIGLFKEIHAWNHQNIENYVEVFLDVPMKELRRRDPKGLYLSYDQGKVTNVAGVDMQVDFPENPHYHFKWHSALTGSMVAQDLFEDFKMRTSSLNEA